jgi:membrane protein
MKVLRHHPTAPERDDAPAPAPAGSGAEERPTPQPEHHESPHPDPGLRDLTFADWKASFIRAGKEMLDDNMTMIASALAYSTFFAIPSVFLVAVGLFTLIAGHDTILTVMQHLGHVMPHQATQLLQSSLTRLDSKPSTGVTMTVVGFILAIWSTTGAMTSYMTALNLAYDRKDRRSFVKKRLTALAMAACIGFAFLLVAGLLVFGPTIQRYVGRSVGMESALGWIWWTAQWPILVLGLLAAFATLLWLGPDVDHPRWNFLTPGSAVAVVIWLAASGGFAVYTSMFGSYNKTWGSLAAVIVLLTWLWLTALALLFGAELNSEIERSRELRQQKPAEQELELGSRA